MSYHRPKATEDMKVAFILGLQTGKQFSQILPRFGVDVTNVAEEIFSSEKQMFLHAKFQKHCAFAAIDVSAVQFLMPSCL